MTSKRICKTILKGRTFLFGKKRPFLALAIAIGFWLPAVAAAESLSGGPLLLLPDDIQFMGKSNLHNIWSQPGEGYIELSGGKAGDPLTQIHVPATAEYDVWTRTEIHPSKATPPRYRLVIDGSPVQSESGNGDTKGWKWEKVDHRTLSEGNHIVALQSVVPWAHVGAILFAPSDVDPERIPMAQLLSYRIVPEPIPTPESQPLAPEVQTDGGKEVAVIESASARLAFYEIQDGAGNTRIVRTVSTKEDNVWKKIPFNAAAESLQLLSSPTATIDTHTFIPSWEEARPFEFAIDGLTYRAADETNPFAVGSSISLQAVSAKSADAGKVTVEYRGDGGVTATGLWSLDGSVEKLEVTLTVPQAGFYSLAFSPFQAWKREDVQNVQLPPLFQKQRIPLTPVTINSAGAPQAMALVQVQSSEAAGPVVYIAAADPAGMPFVWSSRDNSPYALGLLNDTFHIQPTVFSPVLGLPGSKMAAGATLHASFDALALPGDWKKGIAAGYDQIFKVRDYRQPTVSLTEAALNMIDLLKDDDHSGWSARLKGPYNIESYETATQASPLTYFSVAMLTQDENFYRLRALPTLEFTLSRKSPHYSNALPKGDATTYVTSEATRLVYPGGAFGATYWDGVSEMTQGLNPWMADLALLNGKASISAAHSIPYWTELLGVYRLHPTPENLQDVETACDAWLQSDLYSKQNQVLGEMPFYNFGNYPYWWPLLDLYDATGDKKYLEAAQEGAYYTVAGLWSHPSIPDGSVTINPGGSYPNSEFTFWKGAEKFRLGIPRKPNDTPEHSADAWQVAELGLGLRLYAKTNDPIFLTAARNAIIGRFANYPGYYVDGFNDIMMSPRYPYQGPDVTELYYHHIPAHLAFTLDYLFAEAEQVSGGNITFPWVRQQGYVWFTNREFGSGPGRVYGDTDMRPWLDRTAFSIGEPQFNYFGALGKGRFDIVVVNSSKAQGTGHLNLDPSRTGVLLGSPYQLLVNGVSAETGPVASQLGFTLPGNTVAVFRFQSTKADGLPPASPLQAKPLASPMPDGKEILHAFRIRSPFGKDSLYAFLAGEIERGSTVSLTRDGDSAPSLTCTEPPYEFTIYPISMDQDISFSLTVKHADGTQFQTGSFLLEGDKAAHP
jgi:hypothetical protein